ncbi:hypothetical protein HDV02_003322 [Globomyces sp. JEL0801]|nr:hypothetical protein HDV02_003322 [Globomyces sp. JEL0801]
MSYDFIYDQKDTPTLMKVKSVKWKVNVEKSEIAPRAKQLISDHQSKINKIKESLIPLTIPPRTRRMLRQKEHNLLDTTEEDIKMKLPDIHIRPVVHVGKKRIPKKTRNEKPMYTYFDTNIPKLQRMVSPSELPVPSNIVNLSKQHGVQTFIDRAIIPPHVDVAPLFQPKFLRAIKAKQFQHKFKLEKGITVGGGLYLPGLHLERNKSPVVSDSPKLIMPDPINYNSPPFPESDPLTADGIDIWSDDFRQLENQPGWVIYIKYGIIDDNTPSYLIFIEKIKELNIKSAALWILEKIVYKMKYFAVPMVAINCERVIKLCSTPLCFIVTDQLIISCVFNKLQTTKFLNSPARRFLGPDGKWLAAYHIQSVYRFYRTTKQREEKFIQFRAYNQIKRVRYQKFCKKKLLNERVSKNLLLFEEFQNSFVSNGDNLLSTNRVIIHIVASKASHNTAKPLLVERAFQLNHDPNLVVILVIPFVYDDLSKDVEEVFGKVVILIQDCVHFKNPLVSNRLYVIVPEVSKFLGSDCSVGTELYFSQKSLYKIQEICKKKCPFVVADELNPFQLKCHYFGPLYSIAEKLRKSPFYSVGWFKKEEYFQVPEFFTMPPKLNIAELRVYLESLANEQSIDTSWRFCTQNIPNSFYRSKVNFIENAKARFDVSLPDAELLDFWIEGGILERFPCYVPSNYRKIQLAIYIESSGDWKIVLTCETRMEGNYSNGLIAPQQIFSDDFLIQAGAIICQKCKAKRMYGFITAEFIVFESKETNSTKNANNRRSFSVQSKKNSTILFVSLVPYLTDEILKLVAFSSKRKLNMDIKTCQLRTNSDQMHWDPTRLMKNQYVDQSRLLNNYLTRIPKASQRVIFWYDNVEHENFHLIGAPLCTIMLQQAGMKYDEWIVAQSIMEELSAIKLKLGNLVEENEEELGPNATLKELYEGYITHHFEYTPVPEEDIPKPILISSTVVKLLTEDIPSKIAMQVDPSLKNVQPISSKRKPVTKAMTFNQKANQQKLANDKATVLVTTLDDIADKDDEQSVALKVTPWHKIADKKKEIENQKKETNNKQES